jgi:hypothetical protein
MEQDVGFILKAVNEVGMPTLVVVIFVWFSIKLMPDIKDSISANKAFKERQIEQSGEIKAALDNNTLALSAASRGYDVIVQVLVKHMDESRASFLRIEPKLDELAKDNDKIITALSIIREKAS